jgi:hypothetical protein
MWHSTLCAEIAGVYYREVAKTRTRADVSMCAQRDVRCGQETYDIVNTTNIGYPLDMNATNA